MDDIRKRNDECGYTNYLNTYLTFPPVPGPMPEPNKTNKDPGCGHSKVC